MPKIPSDRPAIPTQRATSTPELPTRLPEVKLANTQPALPNLQPRDLMGNVLQRGPVSLDGASSRTPSQPPSIDASGLWGSGGARNPRVADDGALFVTIGGKERQIADNAVNAWSMPDGRVAFSGRDGAGGYENEGQSLRVFDPATGVSTKVLSDLNMIDNVQSARLSDGRAVLVVSKSDGGLGADAISVVDPSRGEVFNADFARARAEGDQLVLEHFTVEQYENGDWETMKPVKTDRLDLNELMSRPALPLQVNRMILDSVEFESATELASLVAGGTPGPNPTYRGISSESLDAWLETHYGAIDQMEPEFARSAARVLDEHAPGMSLGARTYAFELQARLLARAGEP